MDHVCNECINAYLHECGIMNMKIIVSEDATILEFTIEKQSFVIAFLHNIFTVQNSLVLFFNRSN